MTFPEKQCPKREYHGPHDWLAPHRTRTYDDPRYAHCPGWNYSLVSRAAALPIRGLDWLLRKAIR